MARNPEEKDAREPTGEGTESTSRRPGVSPDSLVLTQRGLTYANCLPSETEAGPTPPSGELHPSRLVSVAGRVCTGPGLRVITTLGLTITLAPGQEILGIGLDSERVFRPAAELRVGDYLELDLGRVYEAWSKVPAVPLPPPPATRMPPRLDVDFLAMMDEDLARLLGLYVGNGWISGDTFGIIICDEDPDVLAWVIQYGRARGLNPRPKKGEGCTRVEMKCHQFSLWLQALGARKDKGTGNGAKSARIPETVLQSPPRILAAFLAGYYSADGSASVHQRRNTLALDASTVSPRLARELVVLLQHLGLRASRRCRVNLDGGHWGFRPVNTISVLDLPSRHLFASRIGFLAERKDAILREFLMASPPKYHPRGHRVQIPGLMKELQRHARGLPKEVRTEIYDATTKESCNLAWLADLVAEYPALKPSKAARLIEEPGIGFDAIQEIQVVPGAEWVCLETAYGEPVCANAFIVRTATRSTS